MEKKITKREVINALLNEEVVKNNDTYVAYLENELVLLDKKKNNKTATKNQKENVEIKAEIVSVLDSNMSSISDIQSRSERLGTLSNQKISALLRQLVESGEVVKTIDKKKAFFSVA